MPVATNAGYAPGAWSDSWRHLGSAGANPMGVEWFGMVMGLGFVLSFGYWCTDFLVVQRAMAAESMTAARRTPLLAAIPKMLFPALVILPGMIAIALHTSRGGLLPLGADGTPNYNLAVPVLLAHYLPSGLLGLGLTALMASFMSGMAGQRHRVQHRVDLRHLPVLHPAGTVRPALPADGPRGDGVRDPGRAWSRRTPRPGSTTSWTCSSWCSRS